MPKVDVFDINGKKVSDVELNENVFGIEPNENIVHEVLINYLANQRQGTQSTKTRAEVRGGGRKPYRQKGTGNARQGSIRAPHYVGGGVVFGPTPRDYGFKTNRKERKLALKTALTDKLNEKALVVVNSLELKTAKTKDAIALLDSLKLTGKTLFVSAHDAEMLYLATRNLGNVAVIMADELNVFDIVNSDTLVMDEDSVKYVEEALK